MPDYDDIILGVGNYQHPANQEETDLEIFESDNIQECLDYAKDYDDFEPIENAIMKQETIIEKAILEIDFLISVGQSSHNVLIPNRLKQLRSSLLSNQKKNDKL